MRALLSDDYFLAVDDVEALLSRMTLQLTTVKSIPAGVRGVLTQQNVPDAGLLIVTKDWNQQRSGGRTLIRHVGLEGVDGTEITDKGATFDFADCILAPQITNIFLRFPPFQQRSLLMCNDIAYLLFIYILLLSYTPFSPLATQKHLRAFRALRH